MQLSLTPDQLCSYVNSQLKHFFPDNLAHLEAISHALNPALKRLNYCFSHIKKKYYQEVNNNGQVITQFNHLNSDHYASFLYLLSNEAYKQNSITLAEKLFYLNKSLNGIDCFYSIQLPDIYMFVHPVGTVLGHAKYRDFLAVYQNVTIGSTLNGKYPEFGEGTVMYANTSVIGECKLGNNVVFGAGAALINKNIETNSSVLDRTPNEKIRRARIDVINDVFGQPSSVGK